MTRHRKRRKLKADINVVPYIDVMLVLLIIFMVTAPLLNLGVKVDLPKSKAHTLEQKKDSLVVSIDRDGKYTLNIANAGAQDIRLDDLDAKVRAFHDQNPDAAVYIAADGALDYQKIMDLMTLLQGAGVEHVSLMSKPAHAGDAKQGNR